MADDMNLSMKLLIDPKGRRVLFAEAGKNVVDFLFSMLSLNLGGVASFVSKGTVIRNLRQSVKDLSDLSMIPNKNIDFLVNEVVVTYDPTLLGANPSSSPTTKSYKCPNFGDSSSAYVTFDPKSRCLTFSRYSSCHTYVTLDPKSQCPNCSSTMSFPLTLVCPPNEESSSSSSSSSSSYESGFVKGGVTYMIMDNLVVKPMSTISSITLFHKLNVRDVGALEERTVTLTINEVGKLLEASLQTKNVLTNVFFEEKIIKVKEEKSLESVA